LDAAVDPAEASLVTYLQLVIRVHALADGGLRDAANMGVIRIAAFLSSSLM
jgi:hypothetical protein